MFGSECNCARHLPSVVQALLEQEQRVSRNAQTSKEAIASKDYALPMRDEPHAAYACMQGGPKVF